MNFEKREAIRTKLETQTKKLRFDLNIYEETLSFSSDEIEPGNNIQFGRYETIGDAKKVTKIVNAKFWTIEDRENTNIEDVSSSLALKQWRKKQKEETKRFNYEQRKKVERLNSKMPKLITIDKKYKIIAHRPLFRFDPHYSRSIQGSYYITRDGSDFWFQDYLSIDKKVRTSRFLNDESSWFKGTKEEAKGLILKVKNELNNLKKRQKEI